MKAKKTKKTITKKNPMSVSFSDPIYEALQNTATKNGISKNAVVNYIVMKYYKAEILQ